MIRAVSPSARPLVRLSAWAVIVGVVGIGCATIGLLSFNEPTVELKQINITGFGLSGGTLDLVFDVYNPNAYRLRSTRVEIGLDLEGQHFGDALLERPLDLSPTNHSQVVVPVRFEWAGVGAGAKALLRRQAIAYGVTGAVLLSTPLGARRVTVKGKGDVPLRALAK
jgi:LEA14-like dessication related protein